MPMVLLTVTRPKRNTAKSISELKSCNLTGTHGPNSCGFIHHNMTHVNSNRGLARDEDLLGEKHR